MKLFQFLKILNRRLQPTYTEDSCQKVLIELVHDTGEVGCHTRVCLDLKVV